MLGFGSRCCKHGSLKRRSKRLLEHDVVGFDGLPDARKT